MESLRGLIDSSEIGSLLGDLRRQPFSALAYLMDFVHMVYKSSRDMEYEVFDYYYYLTTIPVLTYYYSLKLLPLEDSFSNSYELLQKCKL